jgi:murein DD-endopeptidase MepM/ murein hydrolase activator NlpD
MAATGSNPKERPLAQPPGSFRALVARDIRLHSRFWVAAVLLTLALILTGIPVATSSAQTAAPTEVSTDAGALHAATSLPVVPILFPLIDRVSWSDTFGDPRSGGRTHAGNDLLAPKMTPILAVVDGVLDWMNFTGKLSSYNNQPYYNILLRGDDGNDYFYIHLNNDTPGTDDGQGGPANAYAPGLKNGSRVQRGDVIGYVGDSGNAEDTAPHLHFEIHLGGYVSATGTQTRPPSAIDPYPSLKAAPTLAEWVAEGKPPLTIPTTGSTNTTGSVTSTTTKPSTTTTSKPPTTTTTTSKPSTTTTTVRPTTSTTVLPPAVQGFGDVKTSDWYYADFAQAARAGVVIPDADGDFHPYALVSRALFTAYLVRAMAPAELEKPATPQQTFKDVPKSFWAYREIEAAARLGLVLGTGDGSTFSPDKLVTRAQMATMICRALGSDPNSGWAGEAASAYLIFQDVPQGYWAQGAIVMTNYLGLMCGDSKGCFRPWENANRAQAVTLMARLLRLLEGGAES